MRMMPGRRRAREPPAAGQAAGGSRELCRCKQRAAGCQRLPRSKAVQQPTCRRAGRHQLGKVSSDTNTQAGITGSNLCHARSCCAMVCCMWPRCSWLAGTAHSQEQPVKKSGRLVRPNSILNASTISLTATASLPQLHSRHSTAQAQFYTAECSGLGHRWVRWDGVCCCAHEGPGRGATSRRAPGSGSTQLIIQPNPT